MISGLNDAPLLAGHSTVAILEYDEVDAETATVVEFDPFVDDGNILDDDGDKEFHTVVTVFEPDTVREGIPFDYVEELLLDPNNYEIEIIREQSEESVIGAKQPNTLNELLSDESIPKDSENSNKVE